MPVSSSLASGGGGGGSKAEILLAITLFAKGLNEAEKVRKELQNLSKETKETSSTSKSAGKDIDTFGQALKGLSGVITGAVGVVASLGASLKAVLDLGRSGAAYSQMTESFETLNNVVAPGINLLQELGDASLGTASKMELMNAASVALAGLTGEFGVEMAGALPQLLQIAKASEKMNPALGSTAFLFQSLTIGLKRLSPRLIDNTGLQIRLSEAYEKLAKERGKAANELTSEEQQLALLNATLAAGDVLIQQAGGSVESLTDIYSQLDANVQNATNSFKAWFDKVIGTNVATSLNAVFFGQQMINDALEKFLDAAKDASLGYDLYIKSATEAALANGRLTQSQADLLQAYSSGELVDEDAIKYSEALLENMGLLSSAAYNASNAFTGINNSYQDYVKSVTQAAVVANKLTEAEARGIVAFALSGKSVGEYDKAVVELTKSLGILTAAEHAGLVLAAQYDAQIEEEAKKFKGLTVAQEKVARSSLSLSDALKLASSDEEKVRIATELFGISLDETSMALYKQEEATLVTRLATEELTDAEREAIETQLALVQTKIAAGEASQKLAEEESKLAEETRKTADEARNAKSAFQEMFEGLNRNLPSAIKGTLDDIEFLLAGGRELQAQFELVEGAMMRGLIPPEEAQKILDILYVKAQALGVELGDTSKYDAIVATMNTLDIAYDKIRAQQEGEKLYAERINDLKKEGVDLTQERLDKERDAAMTQAVINEKFSEAEKILENIAGVDFGELLAGAIDPETFMASFSQLPDQLQNLFVEVFSDLGAQSIEVETILIPKFDEAQWSADLESVYPQLFGGAHPEIPIDIPIPDDLLPLVQGGELPGGQTSIDVAINSDYTELLDWFISGATADQTATVAASFSPELTSEMESLLSDDSLSQSINVAVTDDIQSDLSKLILNDTIETTIRVTVITEDVGAGTSGSKATGGRVNAGQSYLVGELRPEVFIPDSAGRIINTASANPYDNSNTSTSGPIVVNINNPSISNDLDLEMLSYQIARKISERQKGAM